MRAKPHVTPPTAVLFQTYQVLCQFQRSPVKHLFFFFSFFAPNFLTLDESADMSPDFQEILESKLDSTDRYKRWML